MLESRLNILKIVSMYEDRPLGTKEIMRLLSSNGIKMAERTVRYHVKLLEEAGLLEPGQDRGRHITSKGKNMLEGSTDEEAGMLGNWLYSLACHSRLDMDSECGSVIVSTAYFRMDMLPGALSILLEAKDSAVMHGDRILVATEGQSIEDMKVPDGLAAISVLNSATVLGFLINKGIPARPMNIGLLEIDEGESHSMSSLIGLQSISRDVLSIHIRAGMTDISGFAQSGNGKALAMLFDIPDAYCDLMRKLIEQYPFMNVMEFGLPGKKVLGIGIEQMSAGVLIADGMNTFALLKERSVEHEEDLMIKMVQYESMLPLEDACRKYIKD